MKIYKDSIGHLASTGYITLQVPDSAVGEEVIDCPDDWFCWIRNDGTPCLGGENGFLHFTRIGFDENKNEIRLAFERAIANKLVETDEGWSALSVCA